jgi:hypothetical protein
MGYIRHRNDGMAEYTIVGLKEVALILSILLPYLRLKKDLANGVIRIINKYPKIMTPKKLFYLSKLVDDTASFNYSKKRTNTSKTVRLFLENANLFPVETQE